MISTDLPPEIATTDAAALSALSPKFLGDIELKPYSLGRQIIAWEICGAGSHPIGHPIIHVWICTLDQKEVRIARLNREKAFDDAMAWAEGLGFGVGYMDELVEVYNQMHAEIAASMKAMKQQRDDEKNAGAPRSLSPMELQPSRLADSVS